MPEKKRRRQKPLRTIAESFIVALPTGTSTQTRLNPTPSEDAALRQIGAHLGSLYRRDVVNRIKVGVVPSKLNERTTRKQKLTALSSSRWAGSITRAAEDQYQLGLRGLTAEVDMLETSTAMLIKRIALPLHVPPTKAEKDAAQAVKDKAAGIPVTKVVINPPFRKIIRGYRTEFERQGKLKRLAHQQKRLITATVQLAKGHPTIVIGGGQLWRNRNNLATAKLTAPKWRSQWDAARMFLTADGETGAPYGNQTMRVEHDGILSIKVPTPLVDTLGERLRLSVPASFALRGDEWALRRSGNQSIRYDITFDAVKAIWYLRASWSYKTVTLIPPLAALQAGRVIGVDLNADHLTAGIVDTSGNPVGVPTIIPLIVDGLSTTTRDGHLRDAITTLLNQARAAGAAAIAIENLSFSDARHVGRETMGRGRRGKTFRRKVAGIPTGKFRDRLTAMAAAAGIYIIAVDPAYTSQWGGQHWLKPITTKTSVKPATGHQAAAVAIGRRAHGLRIKRRPDGVRSQQRMAPPTTESRRNPASTSITKVVAGPHRHRARQSTG